MAAGTRQGSYHILFLKKTKEKLCFSKKQHSNCQISKETIVKSRTFPSAQGRGGGRRGEEKGQEK